MRNPYFKASSAPKDVTTRSNGSEKVSVFEGFMDFLSCLTIHKNQPAIDTDFLISNSVSFFEREQHEAIHMYLDRDTTGQNYSRYGDEHPGRTAISTLHSHQQLHLRKLNGKMTLSQKLTTARKKKGLTQEELATVVKVTVRTVQRIESGESIPRPFTLKAMATALELPFEDLAQVTVVPAADTTPLVQKAVYDKKEAGHFLQMLCLSCFSFLFIPYIHFLIPAYILKKNNNQPAGVVGFARKTIRIQVYWVIALNLLLLMSLAFNLLSAHFFKTRYFISYLGVFFAIYVLNAFIIFGRLLKAKKLITSIEEDV